MSFRIRALCISLALSSAALLSACGGKAGPGERCDLGAEDGCEDGLVCAAGPEGEGLCYGGEGSACGDESVALCSPTLACEEHQGGSRACRAPLLFVGDVFDSTDGSAVAGAHVLGLDGESVAVTDVAISGLDGRYELRVPAVRDAEGAPIDATFTLRASAAEYQTFPGGVRTALPISAADAAREERGWVLDDTITDIALIPVADPGATRVQIAGHVIAEPPGGVLVVAEAGDTAFTAISDATGAYTIFNVSPGSYEVRGYRADLQLTPVTVDADVDLAGVDLSASSDPLSTLTGSINIVNAPGGSVTSVVLVVESTFSDTFGRGEVPAGLRAPRTGPFSVSGEWTIEGVPDGRYVVLAAFENDRLVRDPDENIAGTGIVVVEVPGPSATVNISESFKVTEALAVVSPGAERATPVSTPPVLEWEDDSSEEYYSVDVYDAYGELVWNVADVPGVSGSDTVTLPYEGPMEVGMYYQFRATSWRQPGGGAASPISTTEDLLGVFYVTE